jgi:hypothetical protein
MSDMDHDSYWYGYLMARHHTFLILGTVLMVMALIFTLTGRCLVKYQGIINRAKDRKTFWQHVAVYYLPGLLCLGLYLYTAN